MPMATSGRGLAGVELHILVSEETGDSHSGSASQLKIDSHQGPEEIGHSEGDPALALLVKLPLNCA